uniref:Odorant receptor n=1 Tax=Yemma signatus TaxID=300820 RepID=A0A385H5B1_9HEMI|nr:odorant receptor [Yemma signatus]
MGKEAVEEPFLWLERALKYLGLLEQGPGWRGNIITIINILAQTSLMVASFARALEEGVTFSERIEAVLIYVSNFHLFAKMVVLPFRRPGLLGLISRIRRVVIESASYHPRFNKLLKRNILFTKLGFFVVAGNFTFMHLVANISSIIKYMDNIYALPFQFYVPFDIKSHFYLACIYTYLISFAPILNLALVTSLLISLVVQTSAAVSYLSERLRGVGGPSVDLSSVISLHQEIIRIVYGLNHLLSDLLYIEFLISSLQICIAGYQLLIGKREGDPRTPVYCFIFVLTLLVPVLFSLCGNEIKLQGERLLDASYDNDWYLLSTQDQARLQVLLTEAGRGLSLSYKGLVTFDMVLYSQVVKTSYSLVAMLETMETMADN